MATRSLQRILRSLFVIAALLVITASWISPVDAGKFFKPPATYEPGSWYVGATPDNLYPNAPVILFVQGLNSTAQTWWDNNDMYELAYQNGYQTAFVQLYDAGGTAHSMWDNGRLLADTIREMYATFRKPFVIVAHSKGGIDTDAALIHYGAYPYVKKVITLGSPHDGAELADLAYSSWAGWLADILGAKSDGTYVLQTGYMQYFRQLTDTHPNAGKTPIVTLAGTKWGSFGSSYYWGGLYLSQFGTNDGVVTVNRAYHPNAPMIAVGGWNHDTIRKGSSTFNIIRQHIPLLTASSQTVTVASVAPPSSLTSSSLTSLASSSSLASPSLPSQLSSLSSSPVSYLSSETINRLSSSFSTSGTSGTQVITTRLSAQTLRPQAVLNGSVYVRGGDAQKKVIETFAVEPSVQSLSLSWLNQGGVKSFTLRDPQGKVQYVQVSWEIDQEWFQGASVTQAAVLHPKPGMWTLEIEQSYASPYLLLAQFASPLNDKFQAKQGIRKWFVTLPDAAKSSIHGAPIWHMTALKYTLEQHTVKKIDRFDLSGIADGTLLELPVPQGLKEDSSEALINYTVDIQGYDEGGFPYNRTLIWSSMP